MSETLPGAETSARERVMRALHAAIATAVALRVPPPVVMRDEPVPQRVPPGGLVVIAAGEVTEEVAVLSPLAWHVEQVVDVTMVMPAQHVEQRHAQLDDLVRDVTRAVIADRTLGGSAIWTQPGSCAIESVEFEGAEPMLAARLPVTVSYLAQDAPSL